jgi:IrrE N-terminal-like domain
MKWAEFKRRYLIGKKGWFAKGRPKTLRALKKVVAKIPSSAFPQNLVIFAPGSDLYGQTWVSSYPYLRYMYLALRLEDETPEEVEFTIAHEFAHIYLHHGARATPDNQAEFEADNLAEHWGFKKPKYPIVIRVKKASKTKASVKRSAKNVLR